MAVGIIRCEEVPLFAELLDQGLSNRVGVHRGGVADAEDVPRTAASGDRIGMAAGYDVQHLLLAGDLRDRNRYAGIDVADDEADLVAFDQLARLLHAGADVIGGVLDQELDRPAQNAALLVDILDGIFSADEFALRDGGVNAGEGIDQSDPDRGFAPGLDDEGRCNLRRSNDSAGFQNGAPIDRKTAL